MDNITELLVQAQQRLLGALGRWNQIQSNIQKALSSSAEEQRDANLDRLFTELEKLTRSNLQLLADICATIGFPHEEKVGVAAAKAVELIMRSAPFEDSESLNSVMDSALECDMSSFRVPSKSIIARFQDKARVAVCGYQLYGFAFTDLVDERTKRRTRLPFPILNIQEVDSRRRELGLKSLYLHALDLQDVDQTVPVMLPARYLVAFAEESFRPPRIPDSLAAPPPAGQWRDISEELLKRQARYISLREGKGTDEDDNLSDLLESNFDYVVTLCAKTPLGFPTDKRVGLQAAQFAWQTVRDYPKAEISQLTTIYNAAVKAHEDDSYTGFPHIEQLSWLLDTRELKDKGFQIFGSLWSQRQGVFRAIAPVPVDRLHNLDTLRNRGELAGWIQQALEIEQDCGLPAYLPLEYFTMVFEGAE